MMTQKTVADSQTAMRTWHSVDLSNNVLGRVASDIAVLLTGKHKVGYAPYRDIGDYVVAINAVGVILTRKKPEMKRYRWHTGYPAGFRERTFREMQNQDPRRVVIHAVAGMLPKNKLRSARLKRLKVFVDSIHPYQDKLVAS